MSASDDGAPHLRLVSRMARRHRAGQRASAPRACPCIGPSTTSSPTVFSQHPRTAALAHLCLALQHLGHLDQAMAAGWEAITQAKRIEHFNSIAYSLCFVSLLIMLRRDIATLRRTAGELLQLAEQHNASYWTLWAKPMLGWIEAQEGKIEAGIRQMHESTAELAKQKANLWVPQTLLLEAEILGAGEAVSARLCAARRGAGADRAARPAILRGGAASRPRRGDALRGWGLAPRRGQYRSRHRSGAAPELAVSRVARDRRQGAVAGRVAALRQKRAICSRRSIIRFRRGSTPSTSSKRETC